MFESTKKWGPISAAFRQFGADSHCRFIHGYGLTFEATFTATHLDHRHWVMDFGGLKPIKAWLEQQFDHKLVVSRFDPLLPEFEALERKGGVELTVVTDIGCEAFARYTGLYVQQWLNDQPWNYDHETRGMPRVRIVKMQVREHEGNSASWIYDR